MSSGNYKLHYFGENGRASISRAILSVGAPNFENVIGSMGFTKDKWNIWIPTTSSMRTQR